MADDFLSYLAKKVRDVNDDYTGRVREALGTEPVRQGKELHDPEVQTPRALVVDKSVTRYVPQADGSVTDDAMGSNQGMGSEKTRHQERANAPVERRVIPDEVSTVQGRVEQGREVAGKPAVPPARAQQPSLAMESKFVPHAEGSFDPARDLRKAVVEKFGENEDPAFSQKLAAMREAARKAADPYLENPVVQAYWGTAQPVHDHVVKPTVEAALKKFPALKK